MKKLLKNSVFRILITIAGTISLLIFLFTYIIPNTLSSPLSMGITIVMFVGFAIIFVVTMICELFYDESTKALVIDVNLEKAHTWILRMKKLDILGWYKDRYLVFMTIYYHDVDDLDALESLLTHKTFQSNHSMKLVHNYNQFYLNMKRNNLEKANEYYSLVKQVYKDSELVKREKIALVYPYGLIKAEKNIAHGNYRQALNDLKTVNFRLLNEREKAKLNYLKYQALYLAGNKIKAQENLSLAQTGYPQAQVIKKIGDN